MGRLLGWVCGRCKGGIEGEGGRKRQDFVGLGKLLFLLTHTHKNVHATIIIIINSQIDCRNSDAFGHQQCVFLWHLCVRSQGETSKTQFFLTGVSPFTHTHTHTHTHRTVWCSHSTNSRSLAWVCTLDCSSWSRWRVLYLTLEVTHNTTQHNSTQPPPCCLALLLSYYSEWNCIVQVLPWPHCWLLCLALSGLQRLLSLVLVSQSPAARIWVLWETQQRLLLPFPLKCF